MASYVASLCEFYDAKLGSPKKNYKGSRRNSGALPDKDREDFINKLVNWLINNDDVTDFFLTLYNEPVSVLEPNMFYIPHNIYDWILNLSEVQFIDLQKVLKSNNLPDDLF